MNKSEASTQPRPLTVFTSRRLRDQQVAVSMKGIVLPGSMGGTSDKMPMFLAFRCSKAFIICTVALSVFTDIFLYAVIVPVIPFALRERAGIPNERTQYWVSILLAVYGAALLAASPVCGWVSDRIENRRLPFLFGLLSLAGATLVLCLGQSIGLLVFGRILQGISAAIVWTVGLAVLVDTVGSQKDIGQALGYVSMAMSLGLLLGPLMGGIVFDTAGFYPVFAMCFGLLALDIICRLFMIERKVAKKWIPAMDSRRPSVTDVAPRTNVPGRQTAGIESTGDRDCHSYDDIRLGRSASAQEDSGAGQHFTEKRASRTPSLVGATAAAKALSDRKASGSKLPPVLTLLKSRRLLAALWGSLVQATLFTAFDSTLPLRVRNIFGWSSLGAGLIFLPLVVPTFSSPVFGWMSDKYGPRWLCVTGFLLSCPFLVLLRLVDHDTLGQKVILCVLLAFLGLSISIAFAPLMAEITYCVEEKERKAPPGTFGKNGAYAQAYALFNVFFAGGCLVGPLWGGLVSEHAGWKTMVWTIGLLTAFTAIPSALWVGGWVGKKTRWINRTGTFVKEDFARGTHDDSDGEGNTEPNVEPIQDQSRS